MGCEVREEELVSQYFKELSSVETVMAGGVCAGPLSQGLGGGGGWGGRGEVMRGWGGMVEGGGR